MMASERQLSEMLGEFARTMLTGLAIPDILDRLVERTVDILPIGAAGVTVFPVGSQSRYIAASETALRFEQLQSELGQGPGVDAYHSGRVIGVPDLSQESRFPEFTPRASDAGLVAVFAFPLHHRDGNLGALDLYRDIPGQLDADSVRAAAMLADVAAAYLINAQERADLQETSDRSRHAALHDGLTGLPNRTLMLERLDHSVLRARRSGLTSAVLFMDLDYFKAVNDTYGHAVGDDLLVAVARRLGAALRPGDTLARLSGDEFVVLCEDLPSGAAARGIVDRVNAALADPFVVSGIELGVTASIGIALTAHGSHTADEALRSADRAMYRAKQARGGHRRALDSHHEDPPDDLPATVGRSQREPLS